MVHPHLGEVGNGEQGCESPAPKAGIVVQHCAWKYSGTIAPKYQLILCKENVLGILTVRGIAGWWLEEFLVGFGFDPCTS